MTEAATDHVLLRALERVPMDDLWAALYGVTVDDALDAHTVEDVLNAIDPMLNYITSGEVQLSDTDLALPFPISVSSPALFRNLLRQRLMASVFIAASRRMAGMAEQTGLMPSLSVPEIGFYGQMRSMLMIARQAGWPLPDALGEETWFGDCLVEWHPSSNGLHSVVADAYPRRSIERRVRSQVFAALESLLANEDLDPVDALVRTWADDLSAVLGMADADERFRLNALREAVRGIIDETGASPQQASTHSVHYRGLVTALTERFGEVLSTLGIGVNDLTQGRWLARWRYGSPDSGGLAAALFPVFGSVDYGLQGLAGNGFARVRLITPGSHPSIAFIPSTGDSISTTTEILFVLPEAANCHIEMLPRHRQRIVVGGDPEIIRQAIDTCRVKE
jgi:hypothetical protein